MWLHLKKFQTALILAFVKNSANSYNGTFLLDFKALWYVCTFAIYKYT